MATDGSPPGHARVSRAGAAIKRDGAILTFIQIVFHLLPSRKEVMTRPGSNACPGQSALAPDAQAFRQSISIAIIAAAFAVTSLLS